MPNPRPQPRTLPAACLLAPLLALLPAPGLVAQDDPPPAFEFAIVDEGSTGGTMPQAGSSVDVPGINLTLLWVAPGEFTMGSPSGQAGRNPDEAPLSLVTISDGYWLGRTEVTQTQWQAIMGTTPAEHRGRDLPVERISWFEAMEFCRKLTERERKAGRLPPGYEYTLPTEAQWEYACRAGTVTPHAGPVESLGWIYSNSAASPSDPSTPLVSHPVARRLANNWGFFDMHGNVSEWCRDGYGRYRGGSVEDPTGDIQAVQRVHRGGNFNFDAQLARSAARLAADPSTRDATIGLRVALSAIRFNTRSNMTHQSHLKELEQTSVPLEVAEMASSGGSMPGAGQTFTVGMMGMEMLWLQPGSFTLGSVNGEKAEKPLTQVTLRSGFWLGKTEVTQAQWRVVMGNNPSSFMGDQNPVEQVSWGEAMDFCRKLTAIEGKAGRLPPGYEYTLPNEAQWEYACRAGSQGEYAGDLDEMGWYERNSRNQANPVAGKKPNAWGFHDMHGNVWEWCRNGVMDYPGGVVTDPAFSSTGPTRAIRGGGWKINARGCRSSYRGSFVPAQRASGIGFRVALVPVATTGKGG